MSIKDNFSQAVKELWKKDGQDAKKPDAAPESTPTELDKYLREPEQQTTAEIPVEQPGTEVPLETPYYRAAEETPAAQGQPSAQGQNSAVNANPEANQPSAQNVREQAPRQENFTQQNAQAQNEQAAYNQNIKNIRNNFGQNNQNDYGYNGAPNNFNNGYGGYIPPVQGGAPMQQSNETEEVTVISKNTIIDGNIRSLANMQIDGNIKGNVETTRNLDMSGKVIGDITCNNAGMNSAAMQGNMSLKGRLRMDRDTILIGDLSSQYADINGRVRGKLDIVGKAELKRDAIVFGDINASTIAVTDGAIIQGYVNTTFLSKEDSRNVFPDAISLDSKETKSE